MRIWAEAIKRSREGHDDGPRYSGLGCLLVFVEAADRSERDGYGPVEYRGKGIIIRDLSPMYLYESRERLQERLLGLQALLPGLVVALVTHDLSSGEIKDLAAAITELRMME